jgi:DNA-binding CsgD family transcriptional regulator
MNALGTREVRALLDIAGGLEYDLGTSAFAPESRTALCELLDADWVTYSERPCKAQRFSVDVCVGTRPFTGDTAELEAVFFSHLHEFPLHSSKAPESGVILMCDVATERTWRRTSFYNEWCREVHTEPQAVVVLNGANDSVGRAVSVDLADDAGRAFGERERTILELIRPSFLGPIVRADDARARRRALGLTPRELEVLELVRDGLTNGEIAATLVISPTTVRSHLEHVFAKLGAHTRTEALARLGDLAGPYRSR